MPNENSAPQPATEPVTQEWPECFTPEDIRLIGAIDIVVQNTILEVVRAFNANAQQTVTLAQIAWKQRMYAFDALLTNRSHRLN